MEDFETDISLDKLEALVERHKGLIIRTVSDFTGRYVAVEHDDEFSIALTAFAEAVEKYKPEKGAFPGFAVLVMKSRLLNYKNGEKRHDEELSLNELSESGNEPVFEDEAVPLREEISVFAAELRRFGLSMEDLVEQAPKHRDTRQRAVRAAQLASEDREIVRKTYEKGRLPLRAVAKLSKLSEKAVKTSKVFILSTMLVFVKKLNLLIGWIKEAN